MGDREREAEWAETDLGLVTCRCCVSQRTVRGVQNQKAPTGPAPGFLQSPLSVSGPGCGTVFNNPIRGVEVGGRVGLTTQGPNGGRRPGKGEDQTLNLILNLY